MIHDNINGNNIKRPNNQFETPITHVSFTQFESDIVNVRQFEFPLALQHMRLTDSVADATLTLVSVMLNLYQELSEYASLPTARGMFILLSSIDTVELDAANVALDSQPIIPPALFQPSVDSPRYFTFNVPLFKVHLVTSRLISPTSPPTAPPQLFPFRFKVPV